MVKGFIKGCSILCLGIIAISLSSCATCGISYRRELTNDPHLREANISYRKAINWLDKAECADTSSEAGRSYTTAESYLSDAMFKLKEQGHASNIDVSEDVFYCEKIKRETDVKIGAVDTAR